LILYCASDLLWATRIKRLADDLGLPCRPVRNPDMLRDRLAEGPVSGLIVDLEAPEADAILAAAGGAGLPPDADAERAGQPASALSRPRPQPLHIIAFGPHVDRARLQMAREQGAETLTRGAFEANLPQILQRLGAA
jgi:hypothetical protein